MKKENIFSFASEEELVSTFRERDKKKLLLPENLQFPFNVRSYMTWKEPSGIYTYLVFKQPHWDLPRGVVFKKTASSGEPIGGLCSWCHSYGTSEDIGMMSVTINSQVSTGYYLCTDLSCIEKIEESCARSGKDPGKGIEELLLRMEKLFENISSHVPD